MSNKEEIFLILNDITASRIISGRFVCLAFYVFRCPLFSKASVYGRLISPSLDSHCLSLTTTVSFAPSRPPFAELSILHEVWRCVRVLGLE